MSNIVTMVNNEAFAIRIKKILSFYNLSATQFADKIGVQRSSISHLLSGRNKPSLDFVIKVIQEFNDVDLYWLLNGKGQFPKQDAQTPSKDSDSKNNTQLPSEAAKTDAKPKMKSNSDKDIEHIIIFYKDGSFKKYEAV